MLSALRASGARSVDLSGRVPQPEGRGLFEPGEVYRPSAATPRPTVPTELPGSEWTLGLQAGTAPAANARPTITFASDGAIAGFGGCNNYSGTYATSGSSMTISALETQPSAFECAPEVVGFQQALPVLREFILKRHQRLLCLEHNVPKMKPLLRGTEGQLNGKGKHGHETFLFRLNGEWEFCKTARKPYDIAVCECLLALKAFLPNLDMMTAPVGAKAFGVTR